MIDIAKGALLRESEIPATHSRSKINTHSLSVNRDWCAMFQEKKCGSVAQNT